jgi:excisionase family DNA binding protein
VIDSAQVWLTAEQAALYMQCGVKVVYRAAVRGELRVARIGGRRDIRTKRDWIDAYLESRALPVESAS